MTQQEEESQDRSQDRGAQGVLGAPVGLPFQDGCSWWGRRVVSWVRLAISWNMKPGKASRWSFHGDHDQGAWRVARNTTGSPRSSRSGVKASPGSFLEALMSRGGGGRRRQGTVTRQLPSRWSRNPARLVLSFSKSPTAATRGRRGRSGTAPRTVFQVSTGRGGVWTGPGSMTGIRLGWRTPCIRSLASLEPLVSTRSSKVFWSRVKV